MALNKGVPFRVEVPLIKLTLPDVVDVADKLNVVPVNDIVAVLITPLEFEVITEPLAVVMAPVTVSGTSKVNVAPDICTAAAVTSGGVVELKTLLPDVMVSSVVTLTAPNRL